MKKLFLDITISTGVITTDELQKLIENIPVDAGGMEGIILSGRMPVWAFAALTHHFHPRPYVATFDPRLGGGVVVASHVDSLKVGDVIDITDADRIDFTFGGDTK